MDCWDGAGLAATGTVDYRVTDLVVPWSRVWPYPVDGPERGGVYFGFRRAAIKHLGFALGVGRGALRAFVSHVRHRYSGRRPMPDGLVTELARSRLNLDAARALGLEAVSGLWWQASGGGVVDEAAYRRVRAVARWATEVAFDICALVARFGDSDLLARQHYSQRALRDIVAGSAHGEMSVHALEAFGRDLLAKEEDFR